MSVVIIGAGNLGIVCAACMASKGVAVTMLTGSPENWSSIVAADDFNGQHIGGPFSVTADPTCVATADIVLLCLPGNAMKLKLLQTTSHLRRGTPVASIFSGDGFFFIAEEVLGADWPVLGFQRVPFIARTKIPYRLGGITGYKKEIFLASRNVSDAELWRQFFENVFATKTALLANFYEAALVNSNVVLHPARIMSLKKQIDENGPFKRAPLFYEEWDDVASEWAIRIDEDLRAVALSQDACIQPLLDYYECVDSVELTRKISSIPAFGRIPSPIAPNGMIDTDSRYVQSDVMVALRFISMLAKRNGVPCLMIEHVLSEFEDGDP